ncbi:hypothetical protein DL546_007879 [Coniochaeta pulveracea]|uniref:ML-like domain-containing protein n=1 Tax=Coniochaeta pulveracea TaxID=177199 RepID=A0A420YCE1_9PEZI|nr:hypothetical protein DL546_007879 [Coniochaeta pulveracea]
MLTAHVYAERVPKYILGTDAQGVTRELATDRTPALYTGDFGDCLDGESLFNVTKFDAAYYKDNLTIIFHVDGTSNIKNESVMLYIGVDAYGTDRFGMAVDPCNLNINSLCPLQANQSIAAWAAIPVGPLQVGGIPDIAFSIPDFDGTTKVRIFANSSQMEIGCFQATMRNGNSFSQPAAIAPVLGVFTLVAIIASVLVAWWSNFAWSAGLIYTTSIVNSVDGFAGVDGNASQVGGAGSSTLNTGGGLSSQIYSRSDDDQGLERRRAFNESNPFDYTWAGDPVALGEPLPGTFSGFSGTLSGSRIPAADVFLVGLIWTLVALALVVFSVTALKFSLDSLTRLKQFPADRLGYFRAHWTRYVLQAVYRTLIIAFFPVMTLALYQFNVKAPAGPLAVAAIVFVLLLAGVAALVTFVCRTRAGLGKLTIQKDAIGFNKVKLFKAIPSSVPIRESSLRQHERGTYTVGHIPWFTLRIDTNDPSQPHVHKDQAFIEKHGWFTARYRHQRWWFLAYYVAYLFFRACLIGGAAKSPLAQVYGLLIYEILAFAIIVILNPFEGARNTALGVWMLSLTKVLSTGLSLAFLPALALDRIIATVIGIIIIVIQGFLVVGVMILIVIGAVSSWMSLTRNREDFGVDSLEGTRVKYFESLERRVSDVPRLTEDEKNNRTEADTLQEEPKEPYFRVTAVRRASKIEDEEVPERPGLSHDASDTSTVLEVADQRATSRQSRPLSSTSYYSTGNGSLPRTGRPHRSSWSSRDFTHLEGRPESSLLHRLSTGTMLDVGDTSVTPLFGHPPDHSPRASRSGTPMGMNGNSRPTSPLNPTGKVAATPSRETLRRYTEERNSLQSRARSRSMLMNDTPVTVEEEK